MDTICSPNSSATFSSCGIRAIVPSSFIISMSAAHGCKPASRARSTAASVCPARFSTPSGWAYRGLMCPGRPKVCAVDLGSASARIVAARSSADTPVVQPSSLSTVMVNGVPSIEVLFATWCTRSNSAQRCSVSGQHSTPRPLCSIKFTFSAVMVSAAVMKSPSFSRSLSSTTITNLPARISSIACSIVSNISF